MNQRPMLAATIGTLFVACGGVEAQNRSACAAAQDLRVMVDTSKRTLWLCETGHAVASYRVALGKGGVGKQREGDGKTPLGIYPLGSPRASQRFGTFIPIGYPTPDQARRGLTGGAVGIHGPERNFGWLGAASSLVNWTLGCIAVANDAAIAEIAGWATRNGVSVIELR